MKVYEKYVNRKMAVGSTQTDEQHQCSLGTQVEIETQEKKKKKKKCRNVKVQTEVIEIVKRHSKSFEKIMRSNDELIRDRASMRNIGKS
jgi:hemerythrin